MNILISSIGAKVGLVKAFRDAIDRIGGQGRVIGIDSDRFAPAGEFCDAFHCVKAQDSPGYWEQIEEICRSEKIGLAVPTREAELSAWSDWRQKTGNQFCQLALSSQQCLQVCADKTQTHTWLLENDFPSPEIGTVGELRNTTFNNRLPLVVKDPFGQGSRGVHFINHIEEIANLPDHWIVQPSLKGIEYTLNAYIDRNGKCRCLIPHRRLQVVDGEVDRAVTEKLPPLMLLGKKITEALPGAYGPINLQVFYESDIGSIWVTDINPRFGGGYPLAHAAGGRFTEWLLLESMGETLKIREEDWQDQLLLLRYRDSLFKSLDSE